jgi:TfoX/Sxy family transcriptional regulator of competence genes
MAFDEGSAERIREFLADYPDLQERKMFGGLAFMVQGHMTVGLSNDDLMVRVGAEHDEEALKQLYARKMDLTGKPMKGFVLVDSAGYMEDEDLAAWLQRGLNYTLSLPPK